MNLKNKITQVQFSDEWKGFYLEDELIIEGHSLRLGEVIKILIEREVSLGEMTFTSIDIIQNGLWVDWVTESEDIFNYSLPKSLNNYFEKCLSLGYDIKFRSEYKFTTIDNVRMYEGDEYYAIDPEKNEPVWSIADNESLNSNWVKFSSLEKVNEYLETFL